MKTWEQAKNNKGLFIIPAQSLTSGDGSHNVVPI